MENIYDNNVLPRGYRFYPTEEELVEFYLRNKLEGKRDEEIQRVIPVVNIYNHNPTELPEMGGELIRHESSEQWFFFIPMQDREARGGRPTRLTTHGYWKATGTPGYVYSSNNNSSRIIGGKRTMVFYKGRAPNGKKTQWKMNEYKATSHGQVSPITNYNNLTNLKLRHEYSLCRVYKKTKCVRAFDRRPAGSGLLLLLPPPHHHNNNNNQVAVLPSNNNNHLIIGTTSFESSSSGEHYVINAGNQNSHEPLASFIDLSETPLWDFDDWNSI